MAILVTLIYTIIRLRTRLDYFLNHSAYKLNGLLKLFAVPSV
ncbi:hypothetical protein [Niallia taxi]|nr:hypothetical protein [Niallia taxi]MDE5051194.1 hypothetical protein [Niallia taxi]MED3964458.1 hypothetical protein [Niallia taxi]WOD62358.1 hypothetical protein NQZ71_16400 [Niallia taxi]